MPAPTNVTYEITMAAFRLFKENYTWDEPIRSSGVSMTDFDFDTAVQFDLSGSVEKRERREKLDRTVDRLKNKFGNYCIQSGTALLDTNLSRFNPFEDHTIHPVSPM